MEAGGGRSGTITVECWQHILERILLTSCFDSLFLGFFFKVFAVKSADTSLQELFLIRPTAPLRP